MPRPPKSAIHEAGYQIKDFFMDDSMKRIIPKNPYNVLWFMEQCLTKEQLKEENWVNFKNFIFNCLKNNDNVDPRVNPFVDKMIDDELVLKRVKNIIENSKVDINTLGLATKAVRMLSSRLIEGLLDLGLDPNISDGKNLPLEVALKRKSHKIACAYWNHDLLNRFTLNKEGDNFAEIAIKNKQWKFFELIIQDQPEIIFGKDKNGNLNVENIITLFNAQKYIPTESDLQYKQLFEAKNQKYHITLVPQYIREILQGLIGFCYNQQGKVDISNPEVKKLWKQAMYKDFLEKFPEDSEKKKIKALKI